jgi:hypothetical protein
MKWTYKRCQEEALKYNTKSEFQKNSKLYQFAYKRKWLNEICSHMKILKKEKFTLKECKELALQCNTRNKFNKKFNSAYCASLDNNWTNDICSQLIFEWNFIENSIKHFKKSQK